MIRRAYAAKHSFSVYSLVCNMSALLVVFEAWTAIFAIVAICFVGFIKIL